MNVRWLVFMVPHLLTSPKPFLNILDEAIHNAASVMRRSPLLFTVGVYGLVVL
jgi:hypothetical protein